MTTPVEIAKAFGNAWKEKNETEYGNLMHPQFKSSCGMNREESIQNMHMCAFQYRTENSTYVTEGNSVMHFFDWIIEAPFQGRTRVAQYFQIENGQVRFFDMVFDRSFFPQEIREQMEQMRREKEALAV
jgi:hypothetical protein